MTSKVEAKRVVSSARDLLEYIDLQDIFFVELNATKRLGESDEELNIAPTETNRVLQRVTDTEIDVRSINDVETGDAKYHVDVVVRYGLTEPLELTPEANQEFVERVAIMAAWPYVREAMADLSRKIRATPVTLGMLKDGQVRATQDQAVVDELADLDPSS